MTREEILKEPAYWTAMIQTELYNCAERFMKENHMNRTQLSKHLGVSKGYVSQLLNGDYDHKISKFVELALSFGVVPQIVFQPIQETIAEDKHRYEIPQWRQASYVHKPLQTSGRLNYDQEYENPLIEKLNIKVA